MPVVDDGHVRKNVAHVRKNVAHARMNVAYACKNVAYACKNAARARMNVAYYCRIYMLTRLRLILPPTNAQPSTKRLDNK